MKVKHLYKMRCFFICEYLFLMKNLRNVYLYIIKGVAHHLLLLTYPFMLGKI